MTKLNLYACFFIGCQFASVDLFECSKKQYWKTAGTTVLCSISWSCKIDLDEVLKWEQIWKKQATFGVKACTGPHIAHRRTVVLCLPSIGIIRMSLMLFWDKVRHRTSNSCIMLHKSSLMKDCLYFLLKFKHVQWSSFASNQILVDLFSPPSYLYWGTTLWRDLLHSSKEGRRYNVWVKKIETSIIISRSAYVLHPFNQQQQNETGHG